MEKKEKFTSAPNYEISAQRVYDSLKKKKSYLAYTLDEARTSFDKLKVADPTEDMLFVLNFYSNKFDNAKTIESKSTHIIDCAMNIVRSQNEEITKLRRDVKTQLADLLETIN